MRILAISDLHGYLPEIPECDLLILAGDYSPGHRDRQWLLGPFDNWLRTAPARRIIGVAGNHDWEFQRRPEAYQGLPWTYLQDSGVEIDGLKIWGTPWTPRFYDWAFMTDEDQLRNVFSRIPTGLDILISHGPPRDILDQNSHRNPCGSYALKERILQDPPRLTIFGHIHESRGYHRLPLLPDRGSLFCNVSYVDGNYFPNGKFFDVSDSF